MRPGLKLVWDGGSVALALHADHADVEVVVAHESRWLIVRDDALALPRVDLDVRGSGLWLSLVDEGDGRWTVGLEAFALAVDDPADERGDLVPLGLDADYDDGRLTGDLLIGDETIPLDVPCRLDLV